MTDGDISNLTPLKGEAPDQALKRFLKKNGMPFLGTFVLEEDPRYEYAREDDKESGAMVFKWRRFST